MFRVIGGIGAGAAADRWGRKPPIVFSIAWFTAFAFLSGLSTSYVMLFVFRGLFGIGMGGMWAAGVPLALEHWPKEIRGVASGLLQGGFSFGFMLSSLVYQLGWPLCQRQSRSRLAADAVGRRRAGAHHPRRDDAGEGKPGLARTAAPAPRVEARQSGAVSIGRLFDHDLRSVTIHTSLLMAAFMFSYHSITFWYATFLGTMKLPPLGYLIALNAGGLFGSIALGQLSETRLGRRGAPTLGMILGTLSAPLYLWSSDPTLLLIGAALVGFGASGAWGIVPGYLSERFPTEARAVGTGFAYHVGAGARGRHPVRDRRAARLRHAARVCDGDVHQHRRRVGARDVVARPRNAGPAAGGRVTGALVHQVHPIQCSTIATATATFNESTCSVVGIRTRSSAAARASGVRPLPSAPATTAIRR